MSIRDRIRRWWNPAKWRDEHPEISDGEGFTPNEERDSEDAIIDQITKFGIPKH
jgi:hypothetical protein